MNRRFEIDNLFIGPLPEEAYKIVTGELGLFRQDRAVELTARALYGQKMAKLALAETSDHLERRRIDKKSGLLAPDEWEEQVERRIMTIDFGQRAQDPDSALFIRFDAEKFKEINDTQGHEAGDRVIGIIADYITEHARVEDGDIVGRLGGDEFGLFASFNSKRVDGIRLLNSIENRLLDLVPGKYPDMPALRWNHSFYRKGESLTDTKKRADVKGEAQARTRSHGKSLEDNRRALALALQVV